MAINFPDSPSNGDTFTANGVVYTYNATQTLWKTSSGGGGSSVTVSDTAPASPSDGDMWYNSLDLNLYVYYNILLSKCKHLFKIFLILSWSSKL